MIVFFFRSSARGNDFPLKKLYIKIILGLIHMYCISFIQKVPEQGQDLVMMS